MSHRIGSRRWALANMAQGDTLYFKASNGVARLMQQINTDLQRVLPPGSAELRVLLAIHPASREVIELVEVRRF